jgi:hypothetical protein
LNETADAYIISLSTSIYPYTLLGVGSNKCLALLRLVAIGDFLSSSIIGGYRSTLAIECMLSENNQGLMNNWRLDKIVVVQPDRVTALTVFIQRWTTTRTMGVVIP